MRVIFNHLLARILYLGSRKLVLTSILQGEMNRYLDGSDDQPKHKGQIESIARKMIEVRHTITDVLEAIEHSKPDAMTAEQDDIVSMIQTIFHKSSNEFEKIRKIIHDRRIDSDVLKQLDNEEPKVARASHEGTN